MGRMRQLLNRGRDEFDENIDDLCKTKWISELLKGAIISVLTIVCLYTIRLLSSGNYEGAKLQEYLEKNILKYVDTTNIKSQILYNGTYDILSEDKVVFVYSKYTTTESDNLGDEYYEKYGEYYDGICLSIFERKEKNIINEILGTEPAYKLVFCANMEGSSMELQYNDFDYKDLDNDGLTEFRLYTNSYFATTGSYEFMLFSKNDGEWCLLTPNIEKMKTSINNETDCNVNITRAIGYENLYEKDINKRTLYLDAAVFKLNDLLNKSCYYVLGITDYGDLAFTKNPFNSSLEILYIFSCEYDDSPSNGNSRNKDYIYVMQQFSDKELFKDPNWNMGHPLISDEKIDFNENGNRYWGIQTEHSTFFAIPNLKE